MNVGTATRMLLMVRYGNDLKSVSQLQGETLQGWNTLFVDVTYYAYGDEAAPLPEGTRNRVLQMWAVHRVEDVWFSYTPSGELKFWCPSLGPEEAPVEKKSSVLNRIFT
jgi:hypothetical protein